MTSQKFGNIAKGLAGNPLGIIALFIVLIYGLAAIVLGLSVRALSPPERYMLVGFLVCFPFLVLGVFAWLVIGHYWKLYAPPEFRDEWVFLQKLPPIVNSIIKMD